MKITAVFSYFFDVDRIPELGFFHSSDDFDVVIFDITPLYMSSSHPGISRKQITSKKLEIKVFYTFKEFFACVSASDGVFFLYLCDRFSEIKAWLALRKQVCFVFDYSLPGHSTFLEKTKAVSITMIRSKVEAYFFQRVLKLMGINYYISTTLMSICCGRPNAIVDPHPDLLLSHDRGGCGVTHTDPSALFVFQNFPFQDYDFKRAGEVSPDFSNYFVSCYELFSCLTKNGVSLTLCFHPKTPANLIPAWSKEFNFCFGLPVSSLGPATLVLGHFSNVMIAGHQAGSKVVILDSKVFQESRWIQSQVCAFSEALNVKPISIEDTRRVVDMSLSGLANGCSLNVSTKGLFSNLTLKIRNVSQ